MSRHLERLLQIDALLRLKQRHTADSLARELEVSERTVRNDLNFLRDRYGAPLEYTPQQGYHYANLDWRLPTIIQTQEPELKPTITRQRQQAQYFTENLGNDVGLDMVLIPKGSFLMGSPEGELERSESEGPQHTVTVPQFFLGKYPVTQAQWQAVAALPQVNRELEPNPSEFEGSDRPVEGVYWYDAVEFCDRLSQLMGRPYRLPSEAEWEYACRAGTATPFHFGETITTDLANYYGTDNPDEKWSGSYGRGPKGIYRQETTPVGSFGVANAFGLYDMHGNVWEWCLDHWHSNYEGAPTDGSVWVTDNEEAFRLLRGGSWNGNPGRCRSASRNYYFPVSRYYTVGFRVVCTAARTQA